MKIKFSTLPLTILVAFLFISPLKSMAQLPGVGIFFQAIARDKMENPAKDRKIYVQTSIVSSIVNSNPILTELHVSKSNDMGVFGLSIGQGNRTGGTASNLLSIPWGNGPLLLNVKIAIEPISPLSNWDYTKEWVDLGTSPFGTVPYALYAGNAANTNNDNKLNISDTAIMLAPYAKAVATIINNPITPLVVLDSVNQKILQKVNIKDSNLVYVTPFQLSLKTFDTSSLSNRINSKLNTSDTIYISNRINTKLNNTDTAYMLRNYAKTNSFSTLAFSGNYADLINKPAVVANIVNTVNGLTGDVLVNKTTMGIANVDNTSDANKPISILTNSALNNKVDKAAINAANGIPSLDANTKIPSYLLPAISFTSVTIANSAAQMQTIGTNALKGTVAVRTDISKTYILSIDNSSNINDWVEILNPGAPVQSVNGKLSNVSLTTSDITEGSNEYFTQSKARLSLTANGPINYNTVSGLLSADTSTSNYSLATRYALQQQNISTITSLNGKVNLIDTANMLYPYSRTIGIKKYIDSVAIVLNSNIVTSNGAIIFPDASASTKGMVQLVGDLSGTATAPIIANNAINTAKIMDGAIATAKVIDAAITDSKIATGISASKVGLSNVNNTSDLNKPISTLAQNAFNLKLNTSDTAAMLSAYLTSFQNLNASKLNKTDTSAMLSQYLTSIQALGVNKLNISDTTNMLIAYRNYQISLNNNKLNKSDTTNMLSNYLTSINSLNTSKLNKTDTSAMLSAYLTSIQALGVNKLNLSDTTAMLSAYLTSLNYKEIASNKSNDATLGGSSPSITLYPTQSAVKQYITNNAGSGTTSSTSPWSIIGNSGMVDGTNFIGTTDAQPLNFVANNVNAGRIDVAQISGQTSLGYGAAATTLKNTSNLYGTKNTAIGFQTLTNTVYGKENTALGYQALYHNNTASGSTAIGYQAMFNAYNLNTATQYNTYNTAIGYQALLGSSTQANNNGRSNTAVGHQTLRSNSSGSNNSALGYLALYMNSTGQGNTGLGYNSLYGNTTGQYNTAIGYGLVNNDVGNYNTAIGYNTLSSNASGNYNTGIGYNAEITGNASNSTVIGNGATTAASNTIQLGNGSVTNVNTSGVYASSNTTESTNSSSGAILISGGAGIAKNLNVGGNLSVTEANVKHLKGTSATPTYLLGSGAGNTPTNVSFTGTDLSGNITFKTSSGLMANSSIFNLSYATPYSTAPAVVFSPANAASASLYSTQSVWIYSGTSYFSINSGSGGLLNNTTYSWNYIVVQ